MAAACEVVITGVGVVSPIGIGKEPFWASLHEGRSGVTAVQVLAAANLPAPFGGELLDFDAKQFVVPRKSLKAMCRETQTGFSAAVLACQDAGIERGSITPDRFGVTFGCEMFYCHVHEMEELFRNAIESGEFRFDLFSERFMSDLNPLWLLKHLPNMLPCHISISYDALGPNNTFGEGEASSLMAVIECFNVIERGAADVMIAGGSGTRLNLTSLMFRGHGNLSQRSDNPAAASRPFDADRDGMVNGEGAAAFVLERREHAEARGAPILARVLGYGRSHDRRYADPTATKNGPRNAIAWALRDAGLTPGDIGHVNAHGASLIEDDAIEAQAIRDTLGHVPVTAPKSFFGNLGAGGGAVEMAASVMSFEKNEVPMTLNYDTPDPACPVNVICGEPHRPDIPVALLFNQSGTGQSAAVIIAAP